MSVPTAVQFQDIEKELAQDETLQKIMGELAADPSSHPDYSVLRGRLLRRDKLVIPKESKLIGVILRELHDGHMGGHRGVQQTHKRVSELFFWTGMMKDIRRYVAACSVCQRCWTQFWSICQTGRSQFGPCDVKRLNTSKKRPIRDVEDRGTVAETPYSIHNKRRSRHMKKDTLKTLERVTPTLRHCFHPSLDPFS